MKKVLLISLLLFFFINSNAQNFILNENFDGGSDTVPPTGWTNQMISGDASVDKFQFNTSVFHFAKPLIVNYAVFDAYNGGSTGGTATNTQGETVALISPKLTTVGLSNLTLSFDKQSFIQAGASVYAEVSTNNGSSWTTVWSQTRAVVEGTPSSVNVKLDAYKGQSSFHIRFRWQNTSTATYRGFFVFDNVQLFERKSIDVRVLDIIEMYNNSCPNANQPLDVVVYNAGTTTASAVPAVLKVGTTTLYDTAYNLAAGASTSLFKSSQVNTASGGAFTFTAYTNLTSDSVRSNDTLVTTRNSSTPPAVPTGGSVNQCGIGSATLSTNRNTGDSTFWFLQQTGGADVGTGNPFVTPSIDKTTTFYVENSRVVQNAISSSAGLYRFNFATDGPGSMFDLTAKNDIIIDSLSQHFAYAALYKMDVYYKSGTYVGSETNSSAWTKLDLVEDTLFVSGYGDFYTMRLKNPLRIPAGTTFGFYVDADKTSITFTNGTLNVENSDAKITGNTVLSANFNGVLRGYYWNGEVFFRKTCSTGRKGITVNVTPRPKGSKLIQGSTFDGVFNNGTANDFDVASLGRTISYELEPPTAFSNADFGTKWTITKFDISSVNGTPIPSSDTSNSAPGTANGMLSYTPSSGWEDSMVLIELQVHDIAKNCDTAIERYIYIAPTPHPNFDAPSVCLGKSIEFKNTTKITRGFVTYEWDFGDGNNSTFESPIHTYSAYGKFNVKLVATSEYGIVSDTTIEIEVFEIPDVKFKVVNACENKDIEFLNSTTISSGTLAFDWNFGDGNTSNQENPKHQYASPGGYNVTLVASANGCSNSLKKFATQFPRPTSAFSGSDGCAGEQINFVNSSTIELNERIGSSWDFGDGTKGTLMHPNHIFNTPGSKTVKLVSISQFGCRDSVTHMITIKPSPIVDFTFDKTCDVDPVNFTNLTMEPSGINVIYSWSFGDGESSTQKSPSHKYNSLGLKKVVLLAQGDNGCSHSMDQDILIQVQPDADFILTNACSGDPVRFVNKTKISAGEVLYKWYFGDGDTSEFNSPVKTYDVSTSTIFIVKLEASVKDGCTDVVTKNVTIHEKPQCGYTVEQSKTDRRTFTFIPNNTSYGDKAYTWVLKGSGRYNEVSPTHTFEYFDNEYNIILDITGDNSCSCNDSTNTITTSWPLGVSDIELNQARLVPNPSNGMVKVINLDEGSSQSLQIHIFTTGGKLVESVINPSIENNQTQLDLNHLAVGVYHVQIQSSASTQTKRLIIN